MKKINAIVVGTHNKGKFREICDLLPKNVKNITLSSLLMKCNRATDAVGSSLLSSITVSNLILFPLRKEWGMVFPLVAY